MKWDLFFVKSKTLKDLPIYAFRLIIASSCCVNCRIHEFTIAKSHFHYHTVKGSYCSPSIVRDWYVSHLTRAKFSWFFCLICITRPWCLTSPYFSCHNSSTNWRLLTLIWVKRYLWSESSTDPILTPGDYGAMRKWHIPVECPWFWKLRFAFL